MAALIHVGAAIQTVSIVDDDAHCAIAADVLAVATASMLPIIMLAMARRRAPDDDRRASCSFPWRSVHASQRCSPLCPSPVRPPITLLV
jgi:hypothetical protein